MQKSRLWVFLIAILLLFPLVIVAQANQSSRSVIDSELWRTWSAEPKSIIDEGNILWIVGGSGITRFDTTNESYTTVVPADGLPHTMVNDVLVAADGTKWFVGDGGLSHYDESAGTWTHYNTRNSALTNDYVEAIAQLADGTIILLHSVQTDNGAIAIPTSGAWVTNASATDLIASYYTTIVSQPSESNAWVNTDIFILFGSQIYDGGSWTNHDSPFGHPFVEAKLHPNGEIWVLAAGMTSDMDGGLLGRWTGTEFQWSSEGGAWDPFPSEAYCCWISKRVAFDITDSGDLVVGMEYQGDPRGSVSLRFVVADGTPSGGTISVNAEPTWARMHAVGDTVYGIGRSWIAGSNESLVQLSNAPAGYNLLSIAPTGVDGVLLSSRTADETERANGFTELIGPSGARVTDDVAFTRFASDAISFGLAVGPDDTVWSAPMQYVDVLSANEPSQLISTKNGVQTVWWNDATLGYDLFDLYTHDNKTVTAERLSETLFYGTQVTPTVVSFSLPDTAGGPVQTYETSPLPFSTTAPGHVAQNDAGTIFYGNMAGVYAHNRAADTWSPLFVPNVPLPLRDIVVTDNGSLLIFPQDTTTQYGEVIYRTPIIGGEGVRIVDITRSRAGAIGSVLGVHNGWLTDSNGTRYILSGNQMLIDTAANRVPAAEELPFDSADIIDWIIDGSDTIWLISETSLYRFDTARDYAVNAQQIVYVERSASGHVTASRHDVRAHSAVPLVTATNLPTGMTSGSVTLSDTEAKSVMVSADATTPLGTHSATLHISDGTNNYTMPLTIVVVESKTELYIPIVAQGSY